MKAVHRVVASVGKRCLTQASSSSSRTIGRPLISTSHAWAAPTSTVAPTTPSSFSTLPSSSTTTISPPSSASFIPTSQLNLTAAVGVAGRGSRRRSRSPSSSQFVPLASFSSLLSSSPSSPSSSSATTRGILTQATNPKIRRQHPLSSSHSLALPSSTGAHRHFWSPRFLRQLGLPWFAQLFYGTIFVIGVGVLAVSLFATSAVFAALFLVAFAGFKLLNRQPHLMRQVMRRQRAPGAPPSLFSPLIDMMTDGVLLDGLKNARGAIERDVLGIINNHALLGRYGKDFHTTGLHKMSMQVVNGGEKHVVMQFLVASSKPREMFVQVVASRHEEEMGGEREGEERWDYEDVSVQTPEGKVIDLTEDLLKGKTGKRIVIDVPPRCVQKEDE